MSDYYNGFSVFFHAAQNIKKLFCFLRGKNGGRFVKNKNIRTAVKHFDYFNGLLFRNGHFIYFFERVNLKTVFFAYFFNFLGGFFEIELAFFAGTEDYVFCCGKYVNQLEMLVNHADFVIESVFRGGNGCLFSVNEYLAVIRKVNTGNHVHKRRFSASVFAED